MSPSSRLGLNPVSSINPLLRQHLGAIVSAALTSVDARRVTSRALQSLDESLAGRPLRVVAAGKAAVGMATAVAHWLGGGRLAGAMMTADVGAHGGLDGWLAIAGGHPLPTERSEAAGRAALALADETARDDGRLLVLLSGGASAMMAVPVPGVTIDEKASATTALLRAGLDISEINMVRRHLSLVKGGQLGARARHTATLAISDVCTPVEDDPLVIGSGPTVPDPFRRAQAREVIERHRLTSHLPESVVRALDRPDDGGEHPAWPTASSLVDSAYWIIASRQEAMRAAAETARRLGYHVVVHAPAVIGEARSAAASLIATAESLPRPACVIASGETVVHVRGHGRGGRNQEMALGALEPLSGLGEAAMACVGTDGRDGPTDAAGAFVDATMWGTLGEVPQAASDRDIALDTNDAYPLLDRLGALIRTGPTGTNVGDLSVVLLR